MKTILFISLLVPFFAPQSALAAQASNAWKFDGSQFVYEALAQTFPEFVHATAKEIHLQALDCFSANEVKGTQLIARTECNGIDADFRHIRKSAPNLFLVLLNQRAAIHNYSSPGITYINLRDIVCKKVGTTYQCSAQTIQ